ncbi:hypothetical protein MHYP_G00268350 [Metynnis hypsauchen]
MLNNLPLHVSYISLVAKRKEPTWDTENAQRLKTNTAAWDMVTEPIGWGGRKKKDNNNFKCTDLSQSAVQKKSWLGVLEKTPLTNGVTVARSRNH